MSDVVPVEDRWRVPHEFVYHASTENCAYCGAASDHSCHEEPPMGEVPSDLAQWFTHGWTQFDRFGLERFSFRYRLIRPFYMSEPYEPGGDVRISAPDISPREYKTRKAADAAAEQWRKAQPGKPVMVQTAVIFWMTQDEIDATPDRQKRTGWGPRK